MYTHVKEVALLIEKGHSSEKKAVAYAAKNHAHLQEFPLMISLDHCVVVHQNISRSFNAHLLKVESKCSAICHLKKAMAEERILLNMLTKYPKNTEKMQKFYKQKNFYHVVTFKIHLICLHQDLIPYDPIDDSD